MRPRFRLFQSHLDLAHTYWKQLLSPGDLVVDATCGNGYDSLILAQLILQNDTGYLYGMDTQDSAIAATRARLTKHLPEALLKRVGFACQSHEQFPMEISPASVQLIVYNLGYLPGGDKTRTTRVESTLTSLNQAITLIQPGGCISITAYPGHPEGKQEKQAVLTFVAQLDPQRWSCCHHSWCNRKEAPELFFLQLSYEEIQPTTRL